MGSAGSFFIETFLVGGGEVVRDACKTLDSKEVHGSFSSGQYLVSKKHRVMKVIVFHPFFCVGMLGKSMNYSTGTWPLCSTF